MDVTFSPLRTAFPSAQRGVVLFIAMIVLVVMSMAGVAMNRSVESSMGVIGNLSYRKSTLQGTEKALADAVAWIDNNRMRLNQVSEANTLIGEGYFMAPTGSSTGAAIAYNGVGEDQVMSKLYWSNARSIGKDAFDNDLFYKIERMCEKNSEVYSNTNCLMGDPPAVGKGNSQTAGAYQFQPPPPLAFRITAKAEGRRNSMSIVQMFYMVPM